ncbi:MAG: hypothetical protein GY898_04015 [Proteobacteria bacterium]|nr:hypothetical protein [Pseudomonadota bacterium]
MDLLTLAIVGDVHLRWGPEDVRFFDSSEYDRVLFVGDLGGYRHSQTVALCRSIATMTKTSLVVPGNHDGPSLGALAGEVAGKPRLVRALSRGQSQRMEAIAHALGPVEVGGYSRHRIADGLDLIVGRPHSMGGPTMAFAPFLAKRFGVRSMEDSAQRLRGLVDDSDADRLLFLAHNGPTGLGDRRGDPWGCDFRDEEGDQGDPDLREALDHAREQGKQVLAVIAGHMHHGLRGGGLRTWQETHDGTLYVNAARVPRVFAQAGRTLRHHVALDVDAHGCRAREVLVPS